jgi:3',5'-cyclic AMP phosphodiesterase CpdA
VNRVVVTGDLFNNPKREDAIAFRNFRASLSRLTGKDVVVIPGNHDQKWLGNVGSPLKELANLEWSSLVIDHEMQCALFCFDSSRDANLAKGRVSREQMMEIATDFETKCVGDPNIRDYLRVSLIHHHPFSFETGRETIVQRALQAVGLTDEYFLRMDDADAFIDWCVRKNIPLILHGHKHVQRHVRKHYWNLKHVEITSVGCGTSLGAEGKALSYNILTWDPTSKSWAVSFYSDPGDGSGFIRQQISLHTI